MSFCARCNNWLAPEHAYCTRCGLPRSATYAQAPLPPQSTPTLRRPGALPVFALIAFLVGVLVVLGSVALFLAAPRLAPPGPLTITLGIPYFVGALAVIPVDHVSAATSPRSFLLNLMVNGSPATPALMPVTSGSNYGVLLVPGGYPYLVSWMDNDADGALSTGDAFGVQPQGVSPPGGQAVSFFILARDGSMIAQAGFLVPSPAMPAVNLGPAVHGSAHSAWIPVATVNPPTAATSFLVRLVVGNNSTSSLPLAPSGGPAVNASVSGGEYIIAWYDVNADGLLDAGDGLNVSLVAGSWPPAYTSMVLYLLWNTGTYLAVANWSA